MAIHCGASAGSAGQLKKVVEPSAGDALAEARKWFLAGEYSAAQRAALRAKSTPPQVLLLLRCAEMIGDLASQNIALQALKALPAADRGTLLMESSGIQRALSRDDGKRAQ